MNHKSFKALLAILIAGTLTRVVTPQTPHLRNSAVLQSMKWSFEIGAEGWHGRNCELSRSDRYAIDGGWSLRAQLHLPRSATIYRRFSIGERRPGLVRYSVFLPEGAPLTLRTLLFLKNKDGLWFQKVQPAPLAVGEWNDFAVDISPSSGDIKPSGHFGRWDSFTQSQMSVIGIKLFSHDTYEGPAFIDAFFGYEACETLEPLRIYNFTQNLREVPLYEKFEVSFTINRNISNPFNPDEIRVDATFVDPDGETSRIPGFFHQNFIRTRRGEGEQLIRFGKGQWKIRFTPTRVGTYSYQITITYRHPDGQIEGPLVTERRHFKALSSENRGFLRVSEEDPRYFEFETGEFFYPIGHNIHSPTDDTPRNIKLLKKGVPPDRGTYAYEQYLDKMSRHGENLVEVWMSSWWLGLEWNSEWRNYWGLNRYNVHNAWKLDKLIEIANQKDIYIHLVVDNHGKVSTWVDMEWENSPYNIVNGGFLKSPEEFYSSRLVRELYKKLYRYIIARWAYTPRIMGIELWSELDLVGDSYSFLHHPSELYWHRELTDYIKEIDPFDHLLTTHYSTNYSRINPNMIRLPNIDYAVVDAYKSKGSVIPLVQATWSFMQSNSIPKPIFVTEYGGSPWGTTPAGLRADLHAGLWSTFMTPTAGTPLFWWFLFIDENDLYKELRSLANFARGEDRRGKNLQTALVKLLPKDPMHLDKVKALCLQNDSQAYVWVYYVPSTIELPPLEDAPEIEGITVVVGNLASGQYKVEFWNTFEGEIIKTVTAKTSRGVLSIDVPPFKCDIALKIKKL